MEVDEVEYQRGEHLLRDVKGEDPPLSSWVFQMALD